MRLDDLPGDVEPQPEPGPAGPLVGSIWANRAKMVSNASTGIPGPASLDDQLGRASVATAGGPSIRSVPGA